jgi:hypothetical protein
LAVQLVQRGRGGPQCAIEVAGERGGPRDGELADGVQEGIIDHVPQGRQLREGG